MAVGDDDEGRGHGNRDHGEARDGGEGRGGSLIDGLLKRAGRVAGGTLDLALDAATASAMFGDHRLRDFLAASASPERLEAMADAGRFLRDARETAGLSLQDLAERLELRDQAVLEGVEEGRAILPLDTVLRAASLLARHDPVPFLIKFLRSYNPGLEATLEQWGVMALPRNYERERRFVNLYRQHDFLRELSDEEYQRFVDYMDASTRLVVEVMQRERSAQAAARTADGGRMASKTGASKARRKATSGAAQKQPSRGGGGSDDKAPAPRARPVVRKVKPKTTTGRAPAPQKGDRKTGDDEA